jgi:glucokinase
MHLLGIHLSATGARAVVVDPRGAVSHSGAASGGDAASAAAEAARQARGTTAIAATGVAVDPLEGLETEAVLEGLGESGPVRLVSTGLAIVSAEVWAGAARGLNSVVCLWIGDSVVAGIMVDGRPLNGAHGLAGSAGWLAINPVERQDYRKLGSLTAEVSTRGIARRLAWRIQTGDESAVLQRAGSLEAITAQHVFDGARGGDGLSISVVRDVAKYIGMAVSNLASAIDPEAVVLAGPMTAAGDLLFEPIRQEAVRRVPPSMAEHFRLELSPLGADAIAIGAARLANPGLARPETGNRVPSPPV